MDESRVGRGPHG